MTVDYEDDYMSGDPGPMPEFSGGDWEPVVVLPVANDNASPLDMVCMASLDGVHIPPREWVVQDWLPNNAVTLLAGGGGVGKSLFTQNWLTAISMGGDYLGMETKRQCAVVYVNCEDEPDEIARRNVDIAKSLNYSVGALKHIYTVARAGHEGNELGAFDDRRLLKLSAFYAQIAASIDAVDAGVLALDNVAHLYTGNENVRSEVTQFVNALVKLAIEKRMAVLLLGHPAKAEESTYSGSTGWENAVRNRLFLTRPKSDDGQEIDPNERILSREKSNYAVKSETVSMAWAQGAFVPLSDIPQSDLIDPDGAAGAMNALFLECLAKCTAQQRAVSESRNAGNYAPRVFASMPSGKRAKKIDYERAFERLLGLGIIAVGQPLWPNPKNRHPVFGIARVAN